MRGPICARCHQMFAWLTGYPWVSSSTGADGFIHHGGAGNTLTALHAGIPQIVFGQGADRPVNARVVAERGCGIIPGDVGLSSNMINAFLNNRSLRKASEEVAAEMAAQPCPGEVAKSLITDGTERVATTPS